MVLGVELVDSHQVFLFLLNDCLLDLFLTTFGRGVNSSLLGFRLLRLLFFGRGFFNDLGGGHGFGFDLLLLSGRLFGLRLRDRLGSLGFFSRGSFSGLYLFSWRVLGGRGLLSLGFFLRFVFSFITHWRFGFAL
jgi:hypothetical protein